MKTFDLAIIGGGMTGLALAAALQQSGLSLAIIEAHPPQGFSLENLTPRVSALNLASSRWLDELGAWQHIMQQRVAPYDAMSVWEQDSFAKIEFTTQGLGVPQLGHIVENDLIRQALWARVAQSKTVEIITALPRSLGITDRNAILTLDDGQMLSAKLAVGADGANSWLRKQADIPLTFRDYGHTALVCHVQTEEPHGHCARQVFSPESILAFLPLAQDNLSSIVWSLPAEQAEYLQHCDEAEFNKKLTVAFNNTLGLCSVKTPRYTFKLTARYARNFAQNRIALIGDAAHTIHPLAGLGVNLGFQDAKILAQEILRHQHDGVDFGEYRYLRNYERNRKAEAAKMLLLMQGLKDLFSGDHPLKKLIRGIGLSATNKMGLLKEQLIKQALGL
ncbi:FAD-dependent monooxygenase [Aggregatibacter kilianii]|uniref:FAD-dependent monooxygenase n=1 Tax=Aggregatibacter kilianii TaxID=2025884 RepID=UPI000D645453|nr:FAD-dependent monooxygenase [Aggregatibacter kilianii]